MHRSSLVRLLAVGVAAGLFTAIPLAASAPAVTHASCTKYKVVQKNGHFTGRWSGCKPASVTGGSGTEVSTDKNRGPAIKIIWARGKGTTLGKLGFATMKHRGRCAKGTNRVKGTFKVSGGTGAAGKAIPKGSVSSWHVCSSENSAYTRLEPGTKWVF